MSDSKQILYFIKQFHMNSVLPSKLSASSKVIISEIIQIMKKGVKSWHPPSYKTNVLDISKPKLFPKGESYNYITQEVMEDFENIPKIGKHYFFSIGIRSFNIYIIKPKDSNDSKNSYKLFDKMIHKIFVWLFVCSHYANASCSPKINIYIYLTNHKKVLPSFQFEINRQNANTAFTLACPSYKNEIYVYRFEEWFKVLIHESFHSFGFDFALMSQETVNKQIFSIFSIKCDLRLYETYCEMWAEIINIIFISVNSYSCNENKININVLTKNIENHLYFEQLFSLFQCSKVLNFYGLTYTDILQKSNKIQYKEKTSVFSYYILKSILMFYCNDFIEWCYVNNKKSIQFTKTQNNVNNFFEFIKSKYKSDEYMNSMSIFENWFLLSNQKNENQKSFILNTLRMSVFE